MRIAKIRLLLMAFFALSTVALHAQEYTNYVNLSFGSLNALYAIGETSKKSDVKTATPNIPSYFYNAKITSIVVTSVKSASSVGNITVWLRAERNGVLVKEVSKNWASTLTFNDFNTEDPRMTYLIWFIATRPTATTIAGATLTGVTAKINYTYTDATPSATPPATESTDTATDTPPATQAAE